MIRRFFIKFDTTRTKMLICGGWLVLIVLWFFTTTDSTTFYWAMDKGGISKSEFSAFGKMQFLCGIAIGLMFQIILKVINARKL